MIAPELLALFVALLCGHLIGDFVLQTNTIAMRKKEHFGWLALHVGIVAIATYICIGDWAGWLAPVLLFVMHIGLDLLKTVVGRSERLARHHELFFYGDQILHLLSLVILTYVIMAAAPPQSFWFEWLGRAAVEGMLILAGWILAVKVGRFIVADRVRRWQPPDNQGIAGAGNIIGQLERTLIFVFVLNGQYAAIGFLIAAKSVYRFAEIRNEDDRRRVEYLLVGSLWSLCFGLLTGLATLASLEMVRSFIP